MELKIITMKLSAINSDFTLATGEIYAIAWTDGDIGSKYEAIKNTYVEMSLLTISLRETIVSGDYVEALNGELVKVEYKTTAKCVSLNGILYLEIE